MLFITIWPLFALICLGYVLVRKGFPDPGFWPAAERVNYFLLFPALLVSSLVDAPLGRTPKEAEAGTLDAMVGADDASFAKVLPVLQCWAGNINRVGPVGAGHKMKLVMNLISMSYAALYAESLVLAAKSGISPQTVRQVIGSSRLSNGFFETFMTYAVDRDREAHKFAIANGGKDVRYANALANEVNAPSFIASATRQYFAMAEAMGHGGDYVANELITLYPQMAKDYR